MQHSGTTKEEAGFNGKEWKVCRHNLSPDCLQISKDQSQFVGCFCKPCISVRAKKYYEKDRQSYIDRAQERHKKVYVRKRIPKIESN